MRLNWKMWYSFENAIKKVMGWRLSLLESGRCAAMSFIWNWFWFEIRFLLWLTIRKLHDSVLLLTSCSMAFLFEAAAS